MLDAAVVGAGVGGCYAAYRLGRDRPGAAAGRVALFERTHRIGGRVWSVRMSRSPDLYAELGAMRLHRGLTEVLDLLEHLGLTPDLAPFAFGRPENPVHVRGVRLRGRDLADGTAVPYRLGDHRRGRGPDDLLLDAAEAVLPGFGALRRDHHEARRRGAFDEAARTAALFATLRDRGALGSSPLRQLAWADVLLTVLGPEATALVHDAGGYDIGSGSDSGPGTRSDVAAGSGSGFRSGSGSGRQNAAEHLDVVFRTPPAAEYLTLRSGMQGLPRTLHTRFTAAGGHTHLGHRLLRVDRAPDRDRRTRTAGPRYRLTFALDDDRGRATGVHVRVHARAVILALPQGPLRELDATALPFTPTVLRDLDAVESVPAHKLFLLYPNAWWRRLGITAGRGTTDGPLRQVWYGGTCPRPDDGDTDGPALLLAAYPNGHSARAWCAADPEPGRPARDTDPTGADAAVVERAHRLLGDMHGLSDLPTPLAACRQDWNRPPHGGAWHVWRPGHDSRIVGPRMRRPVPGEAIHIVGDCWTTDPGSIEGTIDCAETVLREHFGLTPPPWRRPPET
ncbi:flavin monoamine oxidase family protein [Embleya sp. NPDC050493]|uniref:flavin monoamine oxidase family protein n=1 Tax=Embleya sp. NPDC050493 TaxID=3363989 RepID=UPI0037B1F23B